MPCNLVWGLPLSPPRQLLKSYNGGRCIVPLSKVWLFKRTLWLIFNPNRYRSKAAEAFSREILPQFVAPGWNQDVLKSSHRSLAINTLIAGTPDSDED